MTDELLRDYYDTEWGMPITDERELEALSLEAFQVGSPGELFLPAVRHSVALSRGSRPRTRSSVHRPGRCPALLQNEDIIRNERKIRATPSHADPADARACRNAPVTLSTEDIRLPFIAPFYPGQRG